MPNRKASSIEKDESDNAKFAEYCESVYLTVFDNVEEEISTKEELILLLQHFGYNPSKKTVEKYWNEDTDSYKFKQFCEIVRQEEKMSKKDLLKAFKKIDVNNDGFITHDELQRILTKRGERMSKPEVKMMLDEADIDGDGKLNYEEFCEMMESTSNLCRQLHQPSPKKNETIKESPFSRESSKPSIRESSSSKEPPKAVPRPDKKPREMQKTSTSSIHNKSKEERETKDPARYDEKIPKKNSSIKSQQGGPDVDGSSKDEHSQLNVPLKEEPKRLSNWNFKSMKGCFYKEEDEGKIESHHYKINITQPTAVWITIKPSPPKYGKFQDDILENDMTLFLVQLSNSKLVAFSNSMIDGKSCLSAELDIGVYKLFTFSSGAKLLQEESESGSVSLVKGSGEEMRFSKSCKDAFMEVFYRCDLDGNGFLSRSEFNQLQLRTNDEDCDDEAWTVLKENFELTPQEELTPNGFINLNLMEARDPQGGPDELWVTLESMGYSRKLQLTMACPFLLEFYAKKVRPDLHLIGVNDGGEVLEDTLHVALKAISSVKPIGNKRDVLLHTAHFDQRVTLAVENQSNSDVRVRLDCSSSQNMMSHQNEMDVTMAIGRKSCQIFHHMIPQVRSQRMQLSCNDSIEKNNEKIKR